MRGRRLSVVMLVAGMMVVTFLMGGVAKSAAPEVKSLKIGILTNLGWPLGLDMKRYLDVVVPLYNKKGGLAIGGDRYQIDLIVYDSKNDS